MELRKGDLLFSDQRDLLDTEWVLEFLADTYWARDRSRELILRSFANSQTYGLYKITTDTDGVESRQQIGFCRITSDWATFAWLSDFLIHKKYQGKKIGQWMMSCLLEDPRLAGVKLGLNTSTAHSFYKKFGFEIREVMGLTVKP
jgi:GNAT superfamily N-acetyltransferase